MKKLFTTLLAAVIATACCFGLGACGGHKHEYVGSVVSKGTCTEQGVTKFTCSCGDSYETKTDALGHSYKDQKCVRCNEAAPKLTAIATEDLKVGIITLHDDNSTYDKNFLDAIKAACKNQGIAEANLLIRSNIPESAACKDAALNLADEGCQVIFADSFGHEPFLMEAAKAKPNVQFFHATGTKAHSSGLSNYHNAFASIYEGRYLAGVAAGAKLAEMQSEGKITDKNKDENGNIKVGYVGAFTYAEVISGFTSWYLGVKSVVANVVMDVQFTGSWYNETAEREAAKTLIEDRGCALVSQHAESMGAPSACETAKVPNVSYNGSTEESCPNTFIISSRINWTPYYEYFITCAKEGKLADTDWTGELAADSYADGSVALTELGKLAPAKDTQARIDEAAAKIRSGELKIFDCSKFTVKGEKLTTYLADVDDWGDYVADTEAIKTENGVTYFAESFYRSAPYFNIQIDGINYLNVAF